MKEVFRTPRLVAAKARPEDLDYIMAMESDPANSRFIWSGSRDQHMEEIESERDHLLIFYRDGEKVGYCLSEVHPFNVFELRRIAMSEKHRGYGREAILGMFGFAFDTLGAHRLWLDVYPDNVVGIALYESLGMHRDGELRDSYLSDEGEYRNQIIYSLLEDEWQKMQKNIDKPL